MEPQNESYTEPKSLRILNSKAPLHQTTLKAIADKKRKQREANKTPEVSDTEPEPHIPLNYDTFTTSESAVISSSLVKDILKLYEKAYEERLQKRIRKGYVQSYKNFVKEMVELSLGSGLF